MWHRINDALQVACLSGFALFMAAHFAAVNQWRLAATTGASAVWLIYNGIKALREQNKRSRTHLMLMKALSVYFSAIYAYLVRGEALVAIFCLAYLIYSAVRFSKCVYRDGPEFWRGVRRARLGRMRLGVVIALLLYLAWDTVAGR